MSQLSQLNIEISEGCKMHGLRDTLWTEKVKGTRSVGWRRHKQKKENAV